MALETTKREQFVGAAGAVKPSSKSFKAQKASAPEADWYKILGYGHSGAGKTKALEGFLLAGLKVFVASTDIGGDGLRTVKASLKAAGRAELLENLVSWDFTSYQDFETFLKNPDIIEIDGKGLWAWNPDVLVWEGMSNWQERHLGDYVLLDHSPSGKATELRESGLFGDQQDWGAIRKATLRALDKFLITHSPSGKRIHKYVTTLEDNSKQDKLTGEVYKGPLIMGAARSYMAPAFDLIIEMQAKRDKGELRYIYKCGTASTTLAKRRGLPVEAEEPGDMLALWKKITAGN